MPKVRIAGPVRDRDDDDDAPPRPIHPSKIPYSVAWFREKIAVYAFGTIVCGAIMVTAAAWMGGSLGAFGKKLGNGFNVIMQHAGLAVTQVSVPGLDEPLQAKVLKAAAIRVGENMFAADPYAIRKRVETLEAIGSVKVYRLWPNQISIIADPRDPIALWNTNGQWHVIDQKGRSFANVDPAQFMHLPQVEGDRAAEAAASLLATIHEYPDLAVRLKSATRVGGRRWDVKFQGGAEVALPDDARMNDAFASLNLLNARNRLLDLPVARVDARNPERFALRPTPGLPTTEPPIGGA